MMGTQFGALLEEIRRRAEAARTHGNVRPYMTAENYAVHSSVRP